MHPFCFSLIDVRPRVVQNDCDLAFLCFFFSFLWNNNHALFLVDNGGNFCLYSFRVLQVQHRRSCFAFIPATKIEILLLFLF